MGFQSYKVDSMVEKRILEVLSRVKKGILELRKAFQRQEGDCKVDKRVLVECE